MLSCESLVRLQPQWTEGLHGHKLDQTTTTTTWKRERCEVWHNRVGRFNEGLKNPFDLNTPSLNLWRSLWAFIQHIGSVAAATWHVHFKRQLSSCHLLIAKAVKANRLTGTWSLFSWCSSLCTQWRCLGSVGLPRRLNLRLSRRTTNRYWMKEWMDGGVIQIHLRLRLLLIVLNWVLVWCRLV